MKIIGGSIMVIFKNCVTNDDLLDKLEQDRVVILDVRETTEHAHGHIPGSVLIPLGQLEERYEELDKESEIYVICQAGARSNAACRILEGKGFPSVYNVLPGMVAWTGPTNSIL